MLGNPGAIVRSRLNAAYSQGAPYLIAVNRVKNPSSPRQKATVGFVALPNVDAPEEMVDMMGAARAYQANLAAIGLIREMVAKALELGR